MAKLFHSEAETPAAERDLHAELRFVAISGSDEIFYKAADQIAQSIRACSSGASQKLLAALPGALASTFANPARDALIRQACTLASHSALGKNTERFPLSCLVLTSAMEPRDGCFAQEAIMLAALVAIETRRYDSLGAILDYTEGSSMPPWLVGALQLSCHDTFQTDRLDTVCISHAAALQDRDLLSFLQTRTERHELAASIAREDKSSDGSNRL